MEIQANPNICNYHTFAFDHVYGPDSNQKYIYENTAKAAVISVLQVGSLISRVTMQPFLHMGRQEQARPIPWKASAMDLTIPTRVSSLEVWKRSSSS
jgi:hypothetical protein